MALENLTAREALALDLEKSTDRLRDLVDRYTGDVDAWEAPTRGELDRLVAVVRDLDRLGLDLAPDLYRPKPTRQGRGGDLPGGAD